MNAFRTSAAALLLAWASAGVVQASDLPSRPQPMPIMPPMFSWTGFYLGGNLGGGFGFVKEKSYYSTGQVTKRSNPLMGFLGGLQGGYNYQWTDWFVIGAEVDFDWSNLQSMNNVNINGQRTSSFKNMYVGTVRARLGYAADRALMYITGGYAYDSLKGTFSFADMRITNPPVYTFSKTKTQNGWTLGGGLEYALTYNVLVRAEYLYMGFQKFKYNPFGAVGLAGHTTRSGFSVARAGLSYKF
jgi:outer membrane immunogenic protein